MPKSQSIDTNHQGRLALALVAGGLVAGCGGGDRQPWTIDPDGYDGVSETSFPLLANPCTFPSSSTMALSVRRGENAYLTLRATDNMVVAAGQTGNAAECAVPATYRITITEDLVNPAVGNATTEKVFLDYINGTFALGTTSGQTVTPGITMTLGAGSSMVIRGSSGADKIYLGSVYNTASPPVLQYSSINVNGDTSPDVRFTGVTDVKVSTGVGADIISADGQNGTGGVALDGTITFSAYGGPDNDTLTGGKGPSTLNGGDGDDKFIQTTTIGPDTINGGKGTDTVDYSARTAPVSVTVCTTCSSDPGGCIATDTSCHGLADTARGTCDTGACNTAAGTARTSCNTTAGGAKTQCLGDALTTQGTCHTTADTAKTTCLHGTGGCDDQELACEGLCNGDSTCIGLCQADTTCSDSCDSTHTSDIGLCDTAYSNATDATTGSCITTFNSDIQTCTGNFNNATTTCTNNPPHDAGCTTTWTGAYGTCDATEATCQASATIAACNVCTGSGLGDDGDLGDLTHPAEHDLINDDVEIVVGGKGNDTMSALWAPCSNQAATPVFGCTLKGNEGDDRLVGSAFNDVLDGGAGNDTLIGGAGNDTLIGGAGVDTVSYADRTSSHPVSVSLDSAHLWATGQNGEVGENDSIASDIENLIGGDGADFLRGNSGANIIHGGAGADTIEGGAGNDSLYGDAGDDIIYGGAGNDMMIGGSGNDHLYGGDGDDFIDSTDGAANDVVNCDGVNDLAGTGGSSPGTADALIKDGDSSQSCEL
jgi:Ca2+-binding RTX toxin-like protein